MTQPNVVFKDPGVQPEQARTLKEAVFGFFERQETRTPAFQSLVDFYGKDRLAEMWREWVETRRQAKDGAA